MNIRFTSSLTPEDENIIAPRLIEGIAGLLDMLPIAYVIRVDTSDARTYERFGPIARQDDAGSPQASKVEYRSRSAAARG